MTYAQHIHLLREIRDGQDRLTGGKSVAEQERARAKLAEWHCLAQRMDITLKASYTVTARGAELQFATATLTPSGRTVLDSNEPPRRVGYERAVDLQARPLAGERKEA